MAHTVTLLQSQLAQYPSVHHWLANQLQLPEHYSHNLDALWDCLTGYVSLPLHIEWHHDCDDHTDYSNFIQLFEEAAEEVDGLSFRYITTQQ